MQTLSEIRYGLGKRKMTQGTISGIPKELISAYAQLPRTFTKRDVDEKLGDKISRSMKWRYLRKAERLGLIRKESKKYYHKIYNTVSAWVKGYLLLEVEKEELFISRENIGSGRIYGP